MKNKNIFILIGIIFASLLIFIVLKINHKFYLENKYYDKGEYIKLTSKELNELIANKESFLVFTYNNFCKLQKPCEEVFQEFMDKYNIKIVSIHFDDFKKTKLYANVKYAPSIIIVKNGKAYKYLDANSSDDLDKYENSNLLNKWLQKYIYIK